LRLSRERVRIVIFASRRVLLDRADFAVIAEMIREQAAGFPPDAYRPSALSM